MFTSFHFAAMCQIVNIIVSIIIVDKYDDIAPYGWPIFIMPVISFLIGSILIVGTHLSKLLPLIKGSRKEKADILGIGFHSPLVLKLATERCYFILISLFIWSILTVVAGLSMFIKILNY